MYKVVFKIIKRKDYFTIYDKGDKEFMRHTLHKLYRSLKALPTD